MRYFSTIDRQNEGDIDVTWYPGGENLGDYVSKHHSEAHCKKHRKYYVHTNESPKYLQRVLPPHLLRGCVKTPKLL